MKHSNSNSSFLNKELFTRAAANSFELIFITDRQRTILFANHTACKTTGYKQQELIGKKLNSLCPEKCRASCISKMSKALRERGKWTEEVEIQRKNKTTFWGNITVCSYHDDDRKVAGFVCVIHDLSESRAITQRTWESESSLERIIDSMTDALYVVNTKGKILMCNLAHAKMLGYNKEKIIGMTPPYPWLDDHDEDKMKSALNILRKEGTLNNFSISWQRKNGKRFFASLAGSRFGGNAKNEKRYVVTVRDVSDVPHLADDRRTNARFEMLMSEIRRKAVVLRTLDEINRFVLENADVNKIFKAIVVGVKQLVAHDLAGFYIYNEAQQLLMPHTLSKQTQFSRRIAKLPLTLGQGIIGTAAVSGKMALVNNAQMDPRSRYPDGMKPKTEHFIAVPMKGRGTLFGVLVVARNSDPEFIEEEAHLIELFANAATVALENARLFSQLDMHQNNGRVSNSLKILENSFVMQ